MADLGDLWGAVDGMGEDLADFGLTTVAVIGTAWLGNTVVNMGMERYGSSLPPWVGDYVVPGALIVGGALGGGWVSAKYSRNIGTGVGIGLMLAGANRLLKRYAPTVALGSYEDQFMPVGAPADEVLIGVGGLRGLGAGNNDLFDRYLSGLGQQPAFSAEPLNGLGAQNAFSVEPLNGLGANPALTVQTLSGAHVGNWITG